ncbi:hypothetical protein EYZ11_011880 [Aspergillus tanneri]|uniref:Uncharacterized protein n=1 Tax=Aspergillus tanneri TaxID=1220188 RepID=A0A4S3J1N2_9EURO|nr:hypothetical protein EYZ11_011880 [Aspergillus tanneri]
MVSSKYITARIPFNRRYLVGMQLIFNF